MTRSATLVSPLVLSLERKEITTKTLPVRLLLVVCSFIVLFSQSVFCLVSLPYLSLSSFIESNSPVLTGESPPLKLDSGLTGVFRSVYFYPLFV